MTRGTPSAARRTAQRARRRGEEWKRTHPAAGPGGAHKKLSAAERQRLVELLALHPQMPLRRVLELLREELQGKTVSLVTAHRYLREMGIGRRRAPKPAKPARRRAKGTTRYRAAHRREGDAAHYPTDMTQAEWVLVEALFAREGKSGRPSTYGARATLDALFYMARSGCTWRMLPHDFPPWKTVYSAFRRWHQKGLFEEMNARLGVRLRVVDGRPALPHAAVADTQSVKTTEKGGPAAGTAASG
jgi:transposase